MGEEGYIHEHDDFKSAEQHVRINIALATLDDDQGLVILPITRLVQYHFAPTFLTTRTGFFFPFPGRSVYRLRIKAIVAYPYVVGTHLRRRSK